MEKQAARKQMLQCRNQLDSVQRHELSAKIQRRLIASSLFSSAEVLALYSPINNEVATDSLLSAALAAGKQVCFPRVEGVTLQFILVERAEQLQPGSFGVAEPVGGRPVAVERIDLLVVPGVAFDRAGYRLGYGKGFYDRELSRVSSTTVSAGLCYQLQLRERLPQEEHDQRLDYIVTEAELIPCRNAAAG